MTKKRFAKLFRAEATKRYLEEKEYLEKVRGKSNEQAAEKCVEGFYKVLQTAQSGYFGHIKNYSEAWDIIAGCLFDHYGYVAPRR